MSTRSGLRSSFLGLPLIGHRRYWIDGDAVPMIYKRLDVYRQERDIMSMPRCVACGRAVSAVEGDARGSTAVYTLHCLCGADQVSLPFRLVIAGDRPEWEDCGALRRRRTTLAQHQGHRADDEEDEAA